MTKKRIVVGLSGGVDSAVSALMLKAQGHEVVGVFMKNWEDDDDSDYCSTREDFLSAAACADVIGIDMQAVNFAKDYKERVFAYFLRELTAGRTPNPDILCNAEVKFLAFLDYAKSIGADYMATGHYAQKAINGFGRAMLQEAVDSHKDQTYFLYRLNQYQLYSAIFPIGGLTKPQVRQIALDAKIPSALRKDSTGICFIGERPFREFLQRYLPTKTGDIVDDTHDKGTVIGQHQGLAFYTIGQRKGLHIGGIKGAAEDAWFVAHKDMINNRLMVVQGHNHPKLYRHEVQAKSLIWHSDSRTQHDERPINVGDRVWAKTRYRQKSAMASVVWLSEDDLTLKFDQPQWAVTAGQSVVLYKDGLCLGGGVIQ